MTFNFTPEALTALTAFGKRELRWAVLRIPEGQDAGCEVVGTSQGVPECNEETFAAFKALLPADQPRWAVYDLNFMKGGINNNKVIFVQYVPDDCNKNQLKFAYANHKEVVKTKVQQINKEMQINDPADVTRTKFVDEF